MTSPASPQDDISLCPICGCMTHTVQGEFYEQCGKCGGDKKSSDGMATQDDIDEITKALLALPKGKNKPLCWDMDVLVGFIRDREVRARFVELDLLEQAINQGRDMYKYKLQRLADLEKRLDALHTAKEGKEHKQ